MFIHVCQGDGHGHDLSVDSETTTIRTSTSKVTVCTGGSISDGNGGCYYADSCEMLYGPCDCFRRRQCCASDFCLIPCGPDSSGGRNRRCLPPIFSSTKPAKRTTTQRTKRTKPAKRTN